MSPQSQIVLAVACSMALAMAGAVRLAGVRGSRVEAPNLTTEDRVLLVTTRVLMFLIAAAILVLSRIFFLGHTRICIALVLSGASISVALDTIRELRFVRTNVTRRKRYIGACTALGMFLILTGSVGFLASVPGRNVNALNADWPMAGEFTVIAGGRTKLTNYHHGNPEAQNFAVDLGSYPDYEKGRGTVVYSPVNGVIVKAVGTEPEDGSGPAEGNVVVIETPDGATVTLAHLSTGSVRVLAGEKVNAGEEVGKMGQSGSAEVPHLHVHAEKDGAAIAMVFGADEDFLIKGEATGGSHR